MEGGLRVSTPDTGSKEKMSHCFSVTVLFWKDSKKSKLVDLARLQCCVFGFYSSSIHFYFSNSFFIFWDGDVVIFEIFDSSGLIWHWLNPCKHLEKVS